MKKYNRLVSAMACLMLLCIQVAHSQNRQTLQGKVTSLGSVAVKDVIVSLPGTAITVSADSAGMFTIEVNDLSGEIECWAPEHYVSRQLISGRNYIEFHIIPKDKVNYTEDVLRPFRKDNLQAKTTAVNTIGKTGFTEGSTSIEQSIFNALPGLRTVGKSGMPGEGAYFNARGINSFIGNSNPLIVINDVPYIPDMNLSHIVGGYSTGILNAINPNDIQNITYLRGADAAIYGSLGSAGVILIETETATDLETRVEFIGQYGLANNVSKYPMLNTEDYRSYIGNVAITKYIDQGDVLRLFPYLRDDPSYPYNYLYRHNTDWQDMIYHTAFTTDNVLKVKGGDAVAKYDLSLGYFNQEGILKNTDFSRYHMRLNANINITQKLDAFTSMSLAYMNNTLQEQGMFKETNPLLAALAKAPLFSGWEEDRLGNVLPTYAKIRDEEGNLRENNLVSNPLAIVNTAEIQSQMYDIAFNGNLNYRFTPDWKLSGMVGFLYNYDRSEAFFPGKDQQAIMPLSEGLALNTKRMGIKETFNLYFNLNTSWNKKFAGLHNVGASLGGQALTTRREYDSGSGRNTTSDFYRNLKDVEVDGRIFYGYYDQWNWMNFFGTASYAYSNWASAGLTLSYDGASSSGPSADRFYVYPAANAAVFLKNTPLLLDVNWLNRLTVRGDYTTTGNSTFSVAAVGYTTGIQTFRGMSGVVRPISNRGITPEKTTSVNIGLDFSAFKNAVDLTVDVYNNLSSNVLMEKMIPSYFGTNSVFDNIVEIQNRGVEIGLQAYLFRGKNFTALLGGTLAANKNKVVSMGDQGDQIITFDDGSQLINREGESAFSFYGYKTDGVFASQADADNAYAPGVPLTNYAGVPFVAGDVRFVNVEGNSYISPTDQVVLGNANPDFFGRFYASLGFKNFVLTANFAYSYGNEAYNAVKRDFESMKYFENQLVSTNRRWRYDGHITDMPRAMYGDPMDNNRFSDRFVEDASFIKLKELTLCYNFGNDFIPFLRGGTFYVSGENLFTLTKYLGLDPEFSYSYSSMLQGFDYAKVPHSMNVKFGVRLQF